MGLDTRRNNIAEGDGCASAKVPTEILRDASLTIGARGLYALLLTYPADAVPTSAELRALTGMSEGILRRLMHELADRGLMELRRVHGASGRMAGQRWVRLSAEGRA
jgi:hypothetical protein